MKEAKGSRGAEFPKEEKEATSSRSSITPDTTLRAGCTCKCTCGAPEFRHVAPSTTLSTAPLIGPSITPPTILAPRPTLSKASENAIAQGLKLIEKTTNGHRRGYGQFLEEMKPITTIGPRLRTYTHAHVLEDLTKTLDSVKKKFIEIRTDRALIEVQGASVSEEVLKQLKRKCSGIQSELSTSVSITSEPCPSVTQLVNFLTFSNRITHEIEDVIRSKKYEEILVLLTIFDTFMTLVFDAITDLLPLV